MAGSETDRDDEAAVLMLVGGTGLPLILGVLASTFDGVRLWLIDKGILLVPAESLWVLPGIDAGLDFLRIVFLVAAVALFVLAPVLAIRKRRAEQR